MFKTILITGGCGFIGSNFVLKMRREHPEIQIINLDALTYAGNPNNLVSLAADPGYSFVHGRCEDKALVDSLFTKNQIDAVVHFAAESHVDRSISDDSPFIISNVMGTQTLLQAAKTHQIKRYVQVSTDEVYGSLGDVGHFTETSPLEPNNPYSASKAAADLWVRSYINTHNVAALITRCSNNYGPYQFPEKFIPLMIGQIQEGQKLPVYGDGSNIRDWIHVEDHCAGVEAALFHGKVGEIYNLGGESEKRNIDIVKLLLEELGGSEDLIQYVDDRLGHDYRYAINCDKAKKDLGWQQKISFDEGIRSTIQWYQANQAWTRAIKDGTYQKETT